MSRNRRGTGNVWYDRYARFAGKTLGEAATRYLEEYDGKDVTRTAYCVASVLPYIGEKALIDIDDEAMQPFKRDRLNGQGAFDKPAMAGTVNKEVTVVVTILNRACKVWRWIPSVPSIRHVKGPTRQPYPLTWEEQIKLFKNLPTGWDQAAALFAINTGVRKDELFGLRWRDRVVIPDLETFLFILRDTKNGQDRAVICNSIARRCVENMRKIRKGWRRHMKALERKLVTAKLSQRDYKRTERQIERLRRRLTCGLVFPSYNGYKITSISKVMTKAWKNANLPCDRMTKKGIHNLRHSFGHRLRAAGVPAEDRDALLGHSNVSLTQHYAMPDIERLQAMAERVTERRDTVVLRPGGGGV